MKMVRFLGAVLLVSCMVASASDNKTDKYLTMTGWVHDSKCAAAGVKPEPGCVRKCVAGGEKIVFVDDAEKKVYQVSNPKELMNYAGEHVQLKSTLTKEGALKVKDTVGVTDSPASQAADAHQH